MQAAFSFHLLLFDLILPNYISSTQPPVQWVPGLSRGKVRPERAAEHLPPSSAAVMEE